MKYFNLIILSVLLNFSLPGQNMYRPSPAEIEELPQWAQMMYGERPNVFEVEQSMKLYYSDHEFEKNYHTQYYKKWRRATRNLMQADGSVVYPSAEEELAARLRLQADANSLLTGDWSLLGPITAYNTEGNPVGQQSNVYAIAQSSSEPDVLYCGTEPGEIYKSIDGGNSWFNVSLNDPLAGGVNAITIHPNNPDIVLAGSGSLVFKTTDGGNTWYDVIGSIDRTNELLFNPSDPTIAYAATNVGFFRSTDVGETWSVIYGQKSFDVKTNVADPSIVYLLKHSTALNICQFLLSTDAGETFTVQSNGWLETTDPSRHDGGGRLALSEADPDRVYAYLIGEAKAGDTGFIGVYRSDDGGLNWTLPNAPAGGPYNDEHPNLAIGYPAWQYHQGFYNCALAASNTNPDQLLLGGLNLYRSDDGGASFYPLAGYVGGSYNIHVDMQDFRTYGNTTFVTTDGGIYRSEDFFSTDAFEVRMTGIHSSDYWGFGQGWNEDVTVGGLYHNGNLSSFDNWGPGNFLQLGGGEPASGYVNPGESRRVYSSDINGRIIPLFIGDPVVSVNFGIDPNESYFVAESSELEFHPNCYSIAITGKDNQLWKTTDKGVTFVPLYTFGAIDNNRITQIEIAWPDPEVIYAHQMIGGSGQGKLWRSDDGGISWSERDLPAVSNSRIAVMALDPEHENRVCVAFTYASNGQKVFLSEDGGESWENISSPILNNQNVSSLVHTGGCNGGIYYSTNESVYYKNDEMTEWEEFADGLPAKANSNIARPFYRDAKIRLATYGKGIWESPLKDPQAYPIAKISVDKLELVAHCDASDFNYVDHSMLAHDAASWAWTFEGGNPSTANTWQADVNYENPGVYLTTLTVTDANGVSDTDSLYITIEAYVPATFVEEGFEDGFLPDGFESSNPDDGQTWELSSTVGGFGLSNQCMVMRGYDYWPGGDEDDVSVSLDLSSSSSNWLSFDVAYAEYATNYSDSLEILISTDCGLTESSVYFKGGDDLATAPDFSEFYIPDASEWRTDSIDLSAYEGYEDVRIIFRSHTGWGNNVYVDNINLGENNPVDLEDIEQTNLSVYPNPLRSNSKLYLQTTYLGRLNLEIYTMDGKRIHNEVLLNREVQLPQLATGSYLYILRSEAFIKKGLLEIIE